ncbi:MAG: ribosomal protein S12 methylthiotransferase [Gammaproteobacteria bacterium]|jgi:ribosomal protein S12 methylthiotransferase
MSQSQPKVGFVSLGCPKALVDSERILTQLRVEGYQTAGNYDDADVVIVNTCGFVEDAVEESLDAIGEAMAANGKVVVTGCLGARRELIEAKYDNLVSISGPQDYKTVMTAVHSVVPPQYNPLMDLVPIPQDGEGVKLTPKHYAYLKISEGCNHRCSFCIIPSMRGDLVSRPVEQVLAEAQRLVTGGVKELLVVSQDTSAYGVDLRYKKGIWNDKEYETRMSGLCEGLAELGVWARMHYVYPYPHVDKIIPYMAATVARGTGGILPYLDIPFQHAHPRVLKAMKRPGQSENTLERINAWRDICPEITIRSTFIVGFPSETEEEFQYLLDWLEEAQLDRVGCFQYSPVEGATANEIGDQVPDDVKQDRFDRFMLVQQEISIARLQAKIGQTVEVLVDEVDDEGAIGRSWADAPEIDGKVFIDNGQELRAGQIVRVSITDASEYDLFGDVVSS